MKKLLHPLLAALFVIEILGVLLLQNWIDKSQIVFGIAGALSMLSGITIYFIMKQTAQYRAEQTAVQNAQFEDYKVLFLEFRDSCLTFCDTIKSSIVDLSEELADENSRMVSQLEENFTKQSDKICIKTKENVDALGAVVQNEMNHVLASIQLLINQFGEQIDTTKTTLETVISSVKDTLEHQIEDAETRTFNLQHEIETTFSSGIGDIKSLMESIQKLFAQKLTDIQKEYEKMLTDVKIALVNHTGKVSASVTENTEILSKNLDQYSQNISENLHQIWDKNINALEASCKKYLEKYLIEASELLETHNLELMDKHTDYSHQRIEEIADKYNEIMGLHIANLKEEIQRAITYFTNVNCSAFQQNAENVGKLIGTEDKFIKEFTSNNKSLKETIAKGFLQYQDVVGDIIQELEEKMAKNIENISSANQEYLLNISQEDKTVVDNLAEKLQNYSNDFVNKSALAIANVQKDNNLKLQEMCQSYIDFSNEMRAFVQNCDDNNDRTHSSIEDLMKQNDSFLTDLQEVSDSNIRKMNQILNDYLDNMSGQMMELNVDNSVRYNLAMEEYRERFVEANAEALAGAQKDTIDKINSAHLKLEELAENVSKSNKQIKDLAMAMHSILTDTKEAIEKGNEAACENQENFNEDFDTNVSKMKKVIEQKLSDYNDTFLELNKRIKEILDEIQKNTLSYNNTLKFITDSQKEMNSLTSKDVEILAKLVQR